jgi:hypothetical protein
MGVIGRQRQQVSLRLSSPSVEDAVTTVRARRDQASQQMLRLRVKADGRFMARIPGGRYSSPPCLKGSFQTGDDGVVFEGVIAESHAAVDIPRAFAGMGILLALATVLVAVTGEPSPGSYICGIAAVLFGLIGYGLAHLRGRSFAIDCKQLMRELTPLMPGATPLDEGTGGIRHLP